MGALIVDDGEAVGLARRLAERQGISVNEAVISSLRSSLDNLSHPVSAPIQPRDVPAVADLSPEQRADYESLRALVEEAKRHLVPGATSDHSDMYDAYGLPI